MAYEKKNYDPYVSLVHKRVNVKLSTGKKLGGTLAQSATDAILLQREKGRMVVQKNQILYVRELRKPEEELVKEDDSSKNHLRRSN